MKNLEQLYDELEKYNIPVVKVDFHNKKAGIASNGKDTVIAVDYKKIEDSKEEKMIIAEEKAHYETGALYLINADKTTIDKMEYKANKKVYNELIPLKELKKLCEKGLSVVELSDYFGIPIQDVLVAQFLYSNIENYCEEAL
jgi:hypothetical protein